MKKKYLFASTLLGMGLLFGGLSFLPTSQDGIEAKAAVNDVLCSWKKTASKPADSTASKASFGDWTASSHSTGKSGAYYSDGSYKIDDEKYVITPDLTSFNVKDIAVTVNGKSSGSTLKVTTLDNTKGIIDDHFVTLAKDYGDASIEIHETSAISFVKFSMGVKTKGSNVYFAGASVKEIDAAKVVTGIEISPKPLSIPQYETVQLTATLSPVGSSGDVTWTSSAQDIATIDEFGNVKALKVGQTTITAQVAGTNIKDTCVVTVEENLAQRYSLVKSIDNLYVGGEYVIANANKTFALGDILSGKAYAEEIAILSNGEVILDNLNKAQVFTLGGENGKYVLKNQNNMYLSSNLGTSANLGFVETIQDATKWDITFDTQYNATIKGVTNEAGAYNLLRHNSSSKRFSCYKSGQNDIQLFRKVTPPVTGLAIDMPINTTLDSGEQLKLTATIQPKEAVQSTIWSSDNPSVAEINAETGLLTAISAGSATITAKSAENPSIFKEITFTITDNPIISFECINENELPTQYIGIEFDSTGLKFAVTRKDNQQYAVDSADVSFKLYETTIEQPDFVITANTTKATATLINTGFTSDIAIHPEVNKEYVFTKLTDISQLTTGSRVIITNNDATEYKALGIKQNSYDRALSNVTIANDSIKIKFTELDTTNIAIFDVEKGITTNKFALYDGKASDGQGYLSFYHSASNGKEYFNLKTYKYLSDSRGEWKLAVNQDSTISMSAIHETTTGYLNITTKGIISGSIDTNAANHINMYVYTPTVEEKLFAWGHNHMFMDDAEFEGQGVGDCVKHYANSKAVLNDLGTEVITTLEQSSSKELLNIKLRYEAWARANGDKTPYDGVAFVQAANIFGDIDNSTAIILITVIAILSVSAIAIFAISKRKKASI